MRNYLFSVLISATLSSGNAYASNTVQDLMRQKLESAHAILDGLALEDYEKILFHAQKLKDISQATTWYKASSPDFLYYAKSFQNSASNLVEQGKLHSLEGVSLGYVRLQLDCVECHKFVRQLKKAN